MSLVDGARGSTEADDKHISRGLDVQALSETYETTAPARTLTDVLAATEAPHRFDLLILDVEGMEADVLAGLDVDRYRPEFVLVEVNEDRVDAVLDAMDYELLNANFSPRDALYRLRSLQ